MNAVDTIRVLLRDNFVQSYKSQTKYKLNWLQVGNKKSHQTN